MSSSIQVIPLPCTLQFNEALKFIENFRNLGHELRYLKNNSQRHSLNLSLLNRIFFYIPLIIIMETRFFIFTNLTYNVKIHIVCYNECEKGVGLDQWSPTYLNSGAKKKFGTASRAASKIRRTFGVRRGVGVRGFLPREIF